MGPELQMNWPVLPSSGQVCTVHWTLLGVPPSCPDAEGRTKVAESFGAEAGDYHLLCFTYERILETLRNDTT
jgi:hypothetical protein